MQALLHIARTVRRQPLDLTADDVAAAHVAGATDADVQLAVLIAGGVLDVQPDGGRISGPRRRRPPRSIGTAPPRSPHTATATSGSRPSRVGESVAIPGMTARTAVRLVVIVQRSCSSSSGSSPIDATSHSASDMLRPWFIEAAIVGVVAWLVIGAADVVLARRGRAG